MGLDRVNYRDQRRPDPRAVRGVRVYQLPRSIRSLHEVVGALVLTPPAFEVRNGPRADTAPRWPIQKIYEWGAWRDIPGTDVSVTLDSPSIAHYIVSGSGEFRVRGLASQWWDAEATSSPPPGHCSDIGQPEGYNYDTGLGLSSATDAEIANAITIKMRILVDNEVVAEYDFTDAARMYIYTFGIVRPSWSFFGKNVFCNSPYLQSFKFPFPITTTHTVQLSAGSHQAKAQLWIADSPSFSTWGAAKAVYNGFVFGQLWYVLQFTLVLMNMTGFALIVK